MQQSNPQPGLHSLTEIDNYSDYGKLVSKLTNVIHCARKCLKFIRNDVDTSKVSCRKFVRTTLIKNCQRSFFTKEFEALKNGTNVKKCPMIFQLKLYLDEDEIIRCKGRLGFSDLPKSAAFPILLPRNAHLTSLIIQKTHSRLFHYGTGSVLAEIRKLFWIPKGRQTIRGILGKCVICKKVQGRAFTKQPHAPLPPERVTKALPFEVTGLDYSGALNVKNNGQIVKVYMALFTCACYQSCTLRNS